ncbi:enoyl-CoA hydratase/isomerase family protein [Paraburkholderia sp. EG286A]|uniref:enoyl-CoA hydratase/isomerase family protein n=1 Tax=Paraburkholderia sp. EG286A TaxID=3237014 RepID=UPI0034D31B47
MSTVLYETDGAVGVVTMSNPPHNLIGTSFMTDLLGTYARAIKQGCRAILLRSAMRHFCAGADVAGFGDGAGARRHDEASFESLLDALENIPVPTVAAVHGGALGRGFELALTCDITVAADTAFFGMAEASLGLLPPPGGVQRLVQRVGPAPVKEMAMFGRRHDPASLARWGVINFVAAESELPSVSMSWARQLAAAPTVALKGIKQLANLSARGGIAAADARQICGTVLSRSRSSRAIQTAQCDCRPPADCLNHKPIGGRAGESRPVQRVYDRFVRAAATRLEHGARNRRQPQGFQRAMRSRPASMS